MFTLVDKCMHGFTLLLFIVIIICDHKLRDNVMLCVNGLVVSSLLSPRDYIVHEKMFTGLVNTKIVYEPAECLLCEYNAEVVRNKSD